MVFFFYLEHIKLFITFFWSFVEKTIFLLVFIKQLCVLYIVIYIKNILYIVIMSWTDDKVNKLKDLWGKGNTASQIAQIIGGVSRNAVIGKAHRLNLSA